MAGSLPSLGDRMHPSVFNAEDASGQSEPDELTTCGIPSVSVESRFLVSPHHATRWVELWKQLANRAKPAPGCRHFRLVRDHVDTMYFVMYSEWDDAMSYVMFEQEAAVQRLEQELASISFPEEARVLEIIPAEPCEIRMPRADA